MSSVDRDLCERVARLLGASRVSLVETVQELWSGYGELVRARVERGEREWSVIIKYVKPPRAPSGNSAPGRSYRRKLRSYEVETAFYEQHSAACPQSCRVPEYLAAEALPGARLLVLEDVDFAGYGRRCRRPAHVEVEACLRWLAAFHANFMGREPTGIWKIGTYWHLATRPDELAALRLAELRAAAGAIDERLRRARFTSFVHGDAKLQNFCFSSEPSVAAVDFQYVGAGVGVKDVVYLFSSCFEGRESEALAPTLLDFYFDELGRNLSERFALAERQAIEAEWRSLYAYAWADWERFLLGWAPHERRDSYAAAHTERVLSELNSAPKRSSSRA